MRLHYASSFVFLTMFAFACGGGGSSSPDTTPPPERDAEPPVTPPNDGGPEEQVPHGTGTATVEVTKDGAPAAGVKVVFHIADGRVVDNTTTNAAGRASSSKGPAQVTVVDGDKVGAMQLLTYVGVVDGDVLPVTLGRPAAKEALGTIRAQLPGEIASTNPVYVVGFGGCDRVSVTSPAAPLVLTVDSFCAHATGPVFARAFDFYRAEQWWAWKTNVTAPGAGKTTEVTLGPWALGTKTTVHFDTATAPSGTANVGRVWLGKPGDSVLIEERSPAIDPAREFFAPPVLEPGWEYDVQLLSFLSDSTQRFVRKHQKAGPFLAAFSDSLPGVTKLDVTSAGARADVIWTTASPIPEAKVVLLGLDLNVAGSGTVPWAFVVPPGVTSLRTPVLPTGIVTRPIETTSARFVSIVADDDIADFATEKRLPHTTDGDTVERPLAEGSRLRTSARVTR